MKKEKVSVLTRPNGKKTGDKVNKVVKSKSSKLEKDNVTTVPPRGPRISSIVHIRDASVVNNLKTSKKIASKSADKENTTSIPVVKVKKEKKAVTKNSVLAKDKIAVTPKNDENETRGRAKREAKNEEANVSSMAPSKREKRLVSNIESEEVTKKVKTKTVLKTEKSKKAKIEPVDAIENVKPEVDEKAIPKNPITKTEKKMAIENSGDLKLTKQRVLESIKALLKLANKKLDTKKSLLPTENHPIFLQVVCIKIAKTPRRQIRPYLPHSFIGPLDDVAIFVPDLEKGRRKDYEKSVDHWETLFREQGVEGITEIIPMNRVKTEYSQFEMKRKLAMSFDYFLADGRICGHLTHLLGRDFFKRRYPPTPLKLGADDLKKEINNALHKTCLEIHSYGNTHTVQIGSVSMEPAKLVENIWATCETLAIEYPGGWQNIRAIRIKTQNSAAIPIYLTLKSKNSIAVPVVKPKRPRAYKTVEGELTTLPGSATVTVTPEGRIKFKKAKVAEEPEIKSETKEENDDEDDEEEEEEEEEEKNSEDQ